MSEKPVILFESYPDFDGGVLAVYNELVKRGYDKKYDLVWAVYSDFNLKSDYILDNSDLYEWLENVSKNIDSSKAQREICLNKIHKYKDDEWNGIRAKVAGTPMEQMAYNPVISITFGDQSKRFTDVYDKFDFKAAMDKFFADHPDYNK